VPKAIVNLIAPNLFGSISTIHSVFSLFFFIKTMETSEFFNLHNPPNHSQLILRLRHKLFSFFRINILKLLFSRIQLNQSKLNGQQNSLEAGHFVGRTLNILLLSKWTNEFCQQFPIGHFIKQLNGQNLTLNNSRNCK
jgi:hypothetical protein